MISQQQERKIFVDRVEEFWSGKRNSHKSHQTRHKDHQSKNDARQGRNVIVAEKDIEHCPQAPRQSPRQCK